MVRNEGCKDKINLIILIKHLTIDGVYNAILSK